MADMERGDQVIAVQDIPVGFLSNIPKGTTGVIVDVTGFFSTRYTVSFDNGQRAEDLSEGAIRRI